MILRLIQILASQLSYQANEFIALDTKNAIDAEFHISKHLNLNFIS